MQTLYHIIDMISNGYFSSTLDVFTSFSIISAITIIAIKNPIVAVLFLITLFVFIAGYVMCTGLTFIGLAYLLVYVGAVSILFLFILMLINIRVSELVTETKNSLPLVILVTILFNYANDILFFFKTLQLEGLSRVVCAIGIASYSSWEDSLRISDHIASIGYILYTVFAMLLLMVSIILLLAMVGAIGITGPAGSSIQISKSHFFQSNIFGKLNFRKLKWLLMKTLLIFTLGFFSRYFINDYFNVDVFVDYLNPISLGFYFVFAMCKVYIDILFLQLANIGKELYLPNTIKNTIFLMRYSPSPNPEGTTTNPEETVPNPEGTTTNPEETVPNTGGTITNPGNISPNPGNISPNLGNISPNSSNMSPRSPILYTGLPYIYPSPISWSPKSPHFSPSPENASPNPYFPSPFPNEQSPKDLPDLRSDIGGKKYAKWIRKNSERLGRAANKFWSTVTDTEIVDGVEYKVYNKNPGTKEAKKLYRHPDGFITTRYAYKNVPSVLRGPENKELRENYFKWMKAYTRGPVSLKEDRNSFPTAINIDKLLSKFPKDGSESPSQARWTDTDIFNHYVSSPLKSPSPSGESQGNPPARKKLRLESGNSNDNPQDSITFLDYIKSRGIGGPSNPGSGTNPDNRGYGTNPTPEFLPSFFGNTPETPGNNPGQGRNPTSVNLPSFFGNTPETPGNNADQGRNPTSVYLPSFFGNTPETPGNNPGQGRNPTSVNLPSFFGNTSGTTGNNSGYGTNTSGVVGNPSGVVDNPSGVVGNTRGFTGYTRPPGGTLRNFEGSRAYEESHRGFRGNPRGFRGNPRGFRGNPRGFRGNPRGFGGRGNSSGYR